MRNGISQLECSPTCGSESGGATDDCRSAAEHVIDDQNAEARGVAVLYLDTDPPVDMCFAADNLPDRKG